MTKPGSLDLRIEPLTSTHDRTTFTCGVDSLDVYLKTQAWQDMRRKANAVFVLIHAKAPAQVLGYVTLCSTTVLHGAIPEAARKHIPRYPHVSATLIGRLAVRTERQGEGLGSILLAHSLRKAYESAASVGSSLVVVDAINETAASFYATHGFVRLPESMRLILPTRVIGKLIDP